MSPTGLRSSMKSIAVLWRRHPGGYAPGESFRNLARLTLGISLRQLTSLLAFAARQRGKGAQFMADAVAVVQAFYRSIAAGDTETLLALLSPDLEWTEAERFPYYGGVWR